MGLLAVGRAGDDCLIFLYRSTDLLFEEVFEGGFEEVFHAFEVAGVGGSGASEPLTQVLGGDAEGLGKVSDGGIVVFLVEAFDLPVKVFELKTAGERGPLLTKVFD